MSTTPLEDKDRPVVARHDYLTDAGGAPLGVYRLTGERCPLCPPIKKSSVLGTTYTSADGRAETVQCLACDYSVTRPFRDAPGRRMNQGQAGQAGPTGQSGR